MVKMNTMYVNSQTACDYSLIFVYWYRPTDVPVFTYTFETLINKLWVQVLKSGVNV